MPEQYDRFVGGGRLVLSGFWVHFFPPSHAKAIFYRLISGYRLTQTTLSGDPTPTTVLAFPRPPPLKVSECGA